MLIYFNGDSNTAGTELEYPEQQGFAAKLSSKFNAAFTNDAIAGASNDTICRTTREYLNSFLRTPDLIVIGWSDSAREEWFYNGKYYPVNSLGVEVPSFADETLYQYWSSNQGADEVYRSQLSKYWNSRIYQFHLELEHLGIPHLFFNAIESLNYREAFIKRYYVDYGKESVLHFDWKNTFIRPYDVDFSMIQYLGEQGHNQITPGWFHYGESAQDDWATLLYDYIQANLIV